MSYHYRSIRLKGYDYSRPGYYFVTMCVYGGYYLFGTIKNNIMFLNDWGKMVNKWWLKLIKKYTTINLDAHIVMPNHIHGIIHILGKNSAIAPDINNNSEINGNYFDKLTHQGAPLQNANISIQQMVQWFKTMTTNEYIRNVKHLKRKPIYKKLWQRGYYDRIIRNEKELWTIRKYILYNPSKWNK
jgi:putative transposase